MCRDKLSWLVWTVTGIGNIVSYQSISYVSFNHSRSFIFLFLIPPSISHYPNAWSPASKADPTQLKSNAQECFAIQGLPQVKSNKPLYIRSLVVIRTSLTS